MGEKEPNLQTMKLRVNRQNHLVVIPPNKTLLAVLREDLFLTGSKPGCFNGDCGACTIIVDQMAMKSCLMLAMEAVGKEVVTIEGLENSPLQQTFIEEFAFQCGYCTSGFIMNGHALLLNEKNPNKEKIKEWLESNICRCTSYEEIETALLKAIERKKT
ncbi:(2Fe-2S)-binding protein [Niallia circulans]|uniref:(2Fe-2S)-binding protein n=1 Tax=Niallia circulans TaxID=1397 RepID=UPI000BA614F3|nr:(2Fe-2S)-binding protein [Niallia circulans]